MCETCVLQVFYTCITCVWITCVIHLTTPQMYCMCDTITKLPECGVMCGNITEFRVAEDHLSLQGEGDPPPPQTKWYCHTAHHTQVVLCLCHALANCKFKMTELIIEGMESGRYSKSFLCLQMFWSAGSYRAWLHHETKWNVPVIQVEEG